MKNAKSKIAIAAGLSLTFGSALAASAAPITFAQFHELTTGNPNLFTYTESAGSATLFATSIPISFSFVGIPGLPADLQGNQDATLTFTTTTNQPAVSVAGVIDDQQFPVTSTLIITRPTAALEGDGPRTVLLDMTFTSQLLGIPGGNVTQLTGQTASGNTVSYSSDFLSFSNAKPQNFAISLSSWTSSDGGGVEMDPVTGLFDDATAAGAGTFDATVIPEPVSLSLLALAAVPMLGRRRRAAR